MTVTATSSMARSIASAITLLSRSATFQTRVGAASAAAALPHIYGYEPYRAGVEDHADHRPRAIVDFSENFQWLPLQRACTHIRLDVAGQVLVILEDNANFNWLDETSDADFNDSFIDFSNFAGGVMDDMSGLLNDATYDSFGFQSITMLSPPVRTDIADRSSDHDFWFAVFAFEREGLS